MSVITLSTEWRPDDFHYGIIRGKLCSLCPDATVIDNASNIPVFDISHASFIIRNTFPHYPPGSIHIICVHTEGNKEKKHLAVKAKGHYFIGTDNGIFNLILNQEPDEVVSIGEDDDNDEIDLFAHAASMLANGKSLKEIGKQIKNINEQIPLRATIEKYVISGNIIFIDSYGNAISNITRDIFYRVFADKKFRIYIQSNRYYTSRISKRYSEEPLSELVARFNILDLLEVSINGANISELLNISIGSVIRVELLPEEKILNNNQ